MKFQRLFLFIVFSLVFISFIEGSKNNVKKAKAESLAIVSQLNM